MSSQLDILALEPFYGGARRVMLETMIRCSRHRWTVLKLPPRRIERRLTAAAHWFAEQLSRHWVGRLDAVFTSEAMNLADLLRLAPQLAAKPTVVYFHSNQLPEPGANRDSPTDLVNLNTAKAATEIWFNSLYHLRTFLRRAQALVGRHPELSARSPLAEFTGKAHVMPPPVDLTSVHTLRAEGHTRGTHAAGRDKRSVFVETRDADNALLNAALAVLRRRGEELKLMTVGPAEDISTDWARSTISETDEAGQIRAMLGVGAFLSTRTDAAHDHHAIRALAAGCPAVLPAAGFYPELIPEALHPSCLYEISPDMLASRLQDVWHLARPEDYDGQLAHALHQFDGIAACKAIDQRLEELAVGHSVNR